MEELRVRVEEGRLVPVLAQDKDVIAGLGEGDEYVARLTSPRSRSLTQLRLWWVVCGMIADNFEHPEGWELTKDHIDRVLRIGAGHSDVCELADGTYQFFPRSIGFNSLSQEDFNLLMDRAFTVAAVKFGPALAQAAKEELDRIYMGQTSVQPRKPKAPKEPQPSA